MDRLEGMKIFVQVVDAHSFGRAAEALGLPKSTVSRVVKEIEGYLGVKLLQRTTRKLSITPDGEAYFEYCKHILSEVSIMESSFPGRSGQPRGRIKVGMPASLAHHSILPEISEFINTYPEIELILCTSDHVVDLLEGGYDCVIRAGKIQDSTTLVARKLTHFTWVVVASPSYISRYGNPESLEALNQHGSIGYLSLNSGRTADWGFKDGDNEVSIRMKNVLTVNDTDTYINCGLQGLGLIRIASYLAQPYLEDGAFKKVLDQYESPVIPLSLVYPQNKYLTSAFQVFSDWIKLALTK